eukprot:GABV01003583.1.p1 GENE.GABV01003583.1~~GABV01003583.1.p1  ORF type:complete len:105 (+),score=3.74 GABV01003583.1:209-523(+)
MLGSRAASALRRQVGAPFGLGAKLFVATVACDRIDPDMASKMRDQVTPLHKSFYTSRAGKFFSAGPKPDGSSIPLCCLVMWSLRLDFRLNGRRQTGHLKGFSAL